MGLRSPEAAAQEGAYAGALIERRHTLRQARPRHGHAQAGIPGYCGIADAGIEFLHGTLSYAAIRQNLPTRRDGSGQVSRVVALRLFWRRPIARTESGPRDVSPTRGAWAAMPWQTGQSRLSPRGSGGFAASVEDCLDPLTRIGRIVVRAGGVPNASGPHTYAHNAKDPPGRVFKCLISSSIGSGGRDRTYDQLINSQLLYR